MKLLVPTVDPYPHPDRPDRPDPGPVKVETLSTGERERGTMGHGSEPDLRR